MLDASLVNKSLKLLKFLELLGLYLQVSHGKLKNPVSFMERYAKRMIFFSVNVSSPSSENSLQSSIRVNSTTIGVVVSHFSSNTISFYCSCLGRTVI